MVDLQKSNELTLLPGFESRPSAFSFKSLPLIMRRSPGLQELRTKMDFSLRSFPFIHFSANEMWEVFGLHPCNLVQPYCDSFLMSGLGALAHITENEQGAYSKTQIYSLLIWHILPALGKAKDQAPCLSCCVCSAPESWLDTRASINNFVGLKTLKNTELPLPTRCDNNSNECSK